MLETVLLLLIGATICAIVITILFLLRYIGYFFKVNVSTGPSLVQKVKIAYKLHEGQLSDCYQLLTEVSFLWPEKRYIIIHYDDPLLEVCWVVALWRQLSQFLYFKKTKLRSAVGVIVTGEADKDFEMKLDKHKYQYLELPNVDYSVKTFHPYVTTFSPNLAADKAYRSLNRYIHAEKLCAHPYLEIYQDDTIHYMVPLSKQNDFYVDEVIDSLSSN